MRIAVLVPTFRRQDDLERCLSALAQQVRSADQLIVIAREDDEPTHTVISNAKRDGLQVLTVLVQRAGWAHALTKGLERVDTDVVAITDDDAAPRPDWLMRILEQFESDDQVGGVGGRDMIGGDLARTHGEQLRPLVGKVKWYGKVVGNHHIGYGRPRTVEVLKGVNCAYRVELLREVGFDPILKGHGAQIHLELDVGLAIVRRNWKLVYDPAILVDHFPAPRHDRDQRTGFNGGALSDQVHNETLALLRYLPLMRRAAFLGWSVLGGTRAYPGIACWLVELTNRSPYATGRMFATLNGRWLGVKSWLATTP